jgi:hypothetical protein
MTNSKIKRKLTAQEKKTILSSPAFPPHLFKDNFERIFAPVPGMNKIEFTASLILAFYLNQSTKTTLFHDGNEITAIQAAIITAKDLIQECIDDQFEEVSLITNE